LDTVQAAVLKIKLKKLDEYIAARRKAADYYDAAFANHPHITTPYRAANSKHVFHQYTLTLDGYSNVAQVRNELNEYLATQKIPSMIYYPVPAHRQQMFAAFGGNDYNLETTDWLTDRVISLPMHTELEEEQLQLITSEVLKFLSTKS
jgi:dTDP-4-amino-4,6-dideoxygalactose transaminase